MDKLTAKDIASFVGVGISILGMLITAVTFAAWVGALANKVSSLEQTSIKGERIATLEGEVKSLGESNKELKTSVNNLVYTLQRRRRGDE